MPLIEGTEASEVLNGTGREDEIWGFGGNDTLYGFGQPDLLYGGTGDDVIYGGAYIDALYGGAGNDSLYAESSEHGLTQGLQGGPGADLLDAGGHAGGIAQYDDSRSGLTVDLANPEENTGIAAGDSYHKIFGITGSNFDDRLYGTRENNSISGGEGDDLIWGRAGSDALSGDGGNDTIYGGDGVDFIRGTGLLSGGSGRDYLTAEDDSDNRLFGGNGDDRLLGANRNDLLAGGFGNDSLKGQNGADTINAGPGADTIIGARGTDLLRGGGNDDAEDVFVFRGVADLNGTGGPDRIADFEPGIDLIKLRPIDSDDVMDGNQTFNWGGEQAGANSVWYVDMGGGVILQGDVNGDAAADFEIEIAGVDSLTADDFVL